MEGEKKEIKEVWVDNPDNGYTEISVFGGRDTKDNVFLLSSDEVYAYFPGGFLFSYFGEIGMNSICVAKPTVYAMEQGVAVTGKETKESIEEYIKENDWPEEDWLEEDWSWIEGTCDWWCRSLGWRQDEAEYVYYSGGLLPDGGEVNYQKGIRPALWIAVEEGEAELAKKIEEEKKAEVLYKQFLEGNVTVKLSNGFEGNIYDIAMYGLNFEEQDLLKEFGRIRYAYCDVNKDGRTELLLQITPKEEYIGAWESAVDYFFQYKGENLIECYEHYYLATHQSRIYYENGIYSWHSEGSGYESFDIEMINEIWGEYNIYGWTEDYYSDLFRTHTHIDGQRYDSEELTEREKNELIKECCERLGIEDITFQDGVMKNNSSEIQFMELDIN